MPVLSVEGKVVGNEIRELSAGLNTGPYRTLGRLLFYSG